MLRVGLIGLGGMGKTHVQVYKKINGVTLAAVCDPEQQRVDEITFESTAVGYTDYNKMIENEKLDFVDICVPNFLHKPVALAIIAKKIGVLCEKPLTMSKLDAVEITNAANEAGVPFMTAHVIRFWPQYQLLREIIEDKRYGNVLHAYFARLGSAPGWTWNNWMKDVSKSGAVLFDLNIHDADFVNAVFGPPDTITANQAYNEDSSMCHVNTLLKYKNGVYVQTEASWYGHINYPFSMQYRVAFDNALVVMGPDEVVTVYEKDGIKKLMGPNEQDVDNASNIKSIVAYYNEIKYFTDCVEGGVKNPPLCSHESVIDTIRLVELENESILSGGKEIKF